MLLSIGYADDICRRARTTNENIMAPPGVNPEALFRNMWTLLVFSKLDPSVFTQAYSKLSSVSFHPIAEHRMTGQEYMEVVELVSKLPGVDSSQIATYETYYDNYGRSDPGIAFATLKDEFIHKVNTDMAGVFNMLEIFYFSEYISDQVDHTLSSTNDYGVAKRAIDVGFFSWLLSDGTVGLPWGQYIVSKNSSFIFDNAETIASYAIVLIYDAIRDSIDKKLVGHVLFNNICDIAAVSSSMNRVKDNIRTMNIDEGLKEEVLSYLQVP